MNAWVLLGEISHLIGLECSLVFRNFRSYPVTLMGFQDGESLSDRGERCTGEALGRSN